MTVSNLSRRSGAPLALAAAAVLFVAVNVIVANWFSGARLDLTGPDAMVFRCAGQTVNVSYPKIETLEYGQHVSRRYAAAVLLSPVLLLSKSRQHYVTIGYMDAEGKHQALVFRLEKGDIRSALASLEARSGRRVEFQDDDARKAGQ